MDLNPAALLPALPAALENPGRRAVTVDPQLYRRALAVLRVHGIGGEQIARLRPWALGLSLNPPPSSADTLELALLHRAVARKKNVRPLESLAEAITDLDAIGTQEQEAMIRAGLARGDKAPILLEELLRAWRANDGRRLQQLIQTTSSRTERYRTEAHQKRLAARLANQLAEGGVLAVISGADATPDSILMRHLRERGWDTVPVRDGE